MANAKIQDLLRAVLQGQQSGSSDLMEKFSSFIGGNAEASDSTEALVYSAFPMSDAQLAGLKEKLESRFKRKLTFKVEQDASLIGGIRVVVGDYVLDASVKNKIENLKQALTA